MPNNNRWRSKRPNNKEQENYVPPFDAQALAEPIENLAFSIDLLTKLKAGKVELVLDVVKRSEQDLFKISTFNKKNLFEVKGILLARKMFLRPQEKVEKPVAPSNNATSENGANHNAPQKKERNQNPNQRPNNNVRNDRDNKNPNFRDDKRQGDPSKKNTQNRNKNARNDDVSEQKTREEREKLRPAKTTQVAMPKDIYLKINKNAKWGFSDRSGKEVVAPIYDEVFAYKEDLCCVEQNEHFGYIDRQGDEVIPIVYEVACSFSEGYACVCKNGSCGYINKLNEVIVDFKYDAGTAVIDGNCRVKKDGKWGELHLDNPTEVRWII